MITEFAIPTERILTSATPNYTFAEVSDTHLGDIRSVSAYTKVSEKLVQDGTTYTMDMDYTMSYGDDLFIYLGIGDLYNSSMTTNYDVALSDEQLAWLDKKLNAYCNIDKKQGQAFLIFHYFTIESGLNLESGLTNYKQYADSSKKLYDILEKYPRNSFQRS